MSDWLGKKAFTVGILGAGRGGTGLLRFFGHNRVTRVVFMADPDPSASGILEARSMGIPTFSDAEVAVAGELPDFLFDSTGDEALEAKLRLRLRGTSTRLITPVTSRMMVEVLQENGNQVRDDVSQVVGTIQHDLAESLEASSTIVSRINSIMSNMQMLALNASIEAAKAGIHGRGFTVVADHLGRSVEAVRNLTLEINAVNQNIIQVSQRSESVIEKLK